MSFNDQVTKAVPRLEEEIQRLHYHLIELNSAFESDCQCDCEGCLNAHNVSSDEALDLEDAMEEAEREMEEKRKELTRYKEYVARLQPT